MQNGREAEFFAEPEHGEDVVVAMRVEVYDAFAVEDFDDRFEAEIARRQLRRIAGEVLGIGGLVGAGRSEFVPFAIF